MNLIGKTISNVSIIKTKENARSIMLYFEDGDSLRIDPDTHKTLFIVEYPKNENECKIWSTSEPNNKTEMPKSSQNY